MFEQTFIDHTGKRRRWTYILGLSGELLALAVLLLLPLIYTDKMPSVGPMQVAVVAPRPPVKEAPLRTATHVSRVPPVMSERNVFYAPISIPQRPAMIDDIADTAAAQYVPGSISGGASSLSGLLGGGAIAGPPPEPPKPVEPVAKPVTKVPEGPIRRGGEVQEAMILRRVMPVYPVMARQARVQGTVKLLGVIGRDGTIQKLEVISGHPLLVREALSAVRQWVYRPTLLNGVAVEVIAPIEVHFTLSN